MVAANRKNVKSSKGRPPGRRALSIDDLLCSEVPAKQPGGKLNPDIVKEIAGLEREVRKDAWPTGVIPERWPSREVVDTVAKVEGPERRICRDRCHSEYPHQRSNAWPKLEETERRAEVPREAYQSHCSPQYAPQRLFEEPNHDDAETEPEVQREVCKNRSPCDALFKRSTGREALDAVARKPKPDGKRCKDYVDSQDSHKVQKIKPERELSNDPRAVSQREARADLNKLFKRIQEILKDNQGLRDGQRQSRNNESESNLEYVKNAILEDALRVLKQHYEPIKDIRNGNSPLRVFAQQMAHSTDPRMRESVEEFVEIITLIEDNLLSSDQFEGLDSWMRTRTPEAMQMSTPSSSMSHSLVDDTN